MTQRHKYEKSLKTFYDKFEADADACRSNEQVFIQWQLPSIKMIKSYNFFWSCIRKV